jgi:predicted RNase H-like HicB family nuclease
MEIPVLIEPVPGSGFRAKAGALFSFTTEGSTPDEALRRFKEKILEQLIGGAELVSLNVPADNPWLRVAGVFRDDPDFDEWQKEIAEYRRQIEADPDYL